MKISVIQSRPSYSYDTNHPGDWDLAAITSAAQPGFDEGFAMAEQAARGGSQLIVMIEAFNTTVMPNDMRYEYADVYEPLDGAMVQRLSSVAKRYGSYIVAGLYNSRGGKAYNSAVLLGTNGQIVGVYDKVHLPAGEVGGSLPGPVTLSLARNTVLSAC
ncbi:MAG: carbon-nitrogen hydrolase family protein [Anaerolineae bacterium]